jgi:hypothetical protein
VLTKALEDGKFEIKATLSDKAGNTADEVKLDLTIDTEPPGISLFVNHEETVASSLFPIKGRVEDNQVNSISVNLNYRPLKNIAVSNGLFNDVVEILPGSNTLSLSAQDKAGNTAAAQITIFNTSSAAGAPLSVDNLLNYPNPYSPNFGPVTLYSAEKGRQATLLSYALNRSAQVDIRLYNLLGEMVWCQAFADGQAPGGIAGDNKIEWYGDNIFGEIVPNGVYLVHLIATDSQGNKASAKSKIIVMR